MKKIQWRHLLLPFKQYWEQWKAKRHRMSPKERRYQTIFMVIMSVCAVIILLSGVSLFQSYSKVRSLRTEQATVQKESSELKETQSTLKHEISMLKDSSYIEKLARARYFLSKPGEQIYVFPEESDTSSSSGTTSTTLDTTDAGTTVTSDNQMGTTKTTTE